MSVELPENVGYGKVVGRFLLAVADGPDPGREPDGKPAVGKVTFTPAPERLLNVTAVPPVTIIPKPIECFLDAQGFLIDPEGAQGVWLIATDDTDLNPSGWTYQVQVALEGATRWTFNLKVPQGQTIDLTTVLPVASTPGNAVVRGESGDSAYEVAVAEGFVGTENDWLASLVGPPGIGVADITVDTTVGTRVFVGGVRVHGDTGWRDIRSLVAPNTLDFSLSVPRFALRRINDQVFLSMRSQAATAVHGTQSTLNVLNNTLPTGFRESPPTYASFMSASYGPGIVSSGNFGGGAYFQLKTTSDWSGAAIGFLSSWLTPQAWPTALPGSPA